MAAVTADQVEVELTADIDNYLRNIKRADTEFSRIMRSIEANAEMLGREIGKAMGGDLSGASLSGVAAQARDMARAARSEAILSGRAIESIGGAAQKSSLSVTAMFRDARQMMREAQNQAILTGREFSAVGGSARAAGAQIASSFVAANTAASASSFQVGNIAAQFQDIGVTAAMGMNPMLIALQQGTQLSAVLNQSMSAGVSPVRALGAAFMQIINPISLGTIALIALGVAASQYLGDLISQGQVSNETLKEQDELIRGVADKWGDAVPALQAYIDQLDRAADVGSLGEATELAIKRQYEALIQTVSDLRAEFAAARIDIQQMGGEASEIDALQAAFDELEQKARDGTATADDLNRVLALISSTTGAATPGVAALSGVLIGLASAFTVASQAANTFRQEKDAALAPTAQVEAFNSNASFVAEQERINSLTTEQLALEREVARVKAEAARGDNPVLISEAQALSLAEGRLKAEAGRAAIIKANREADKAGGKSISEAEREAKAVLDLISALEYEQSLIGMTNEQKAVANALRQAGAAATDTQRERIEELIVATMAEQDAIKAMEDTMRTMQNMASTALTGFISDLRAGKDGAEALSNMLNKIADQLIQMAIQGLVQSAFGGLFGGGGLGGIFGGIFGGARANGGPVSSARTYLVGERGPELFTPSSAGNITPNHALGGGQRSEVTVVVEASEYFDGRVARVSGPVAARTVAAGIGQYDSNLSSRMVEQDARNN